MKKQIIEQIIDKEFAPHDVESAEKDEKPEKAKKKEEKKEDKKAEKKSEEKKK